MGQISRQSSSKQPSYGKLFDVIGVDNVDRIKFCDASSNSGRKRVDGKCGNAASMLDCYHAFYVNIEYTAGSYVIISL